MSTTRNVGHEYEFLVTEFFRFGCDRQSIRTSLLYSSTKSREGRKPIYVVLRLVAGSHPFDYHPLLKSGVKRLCLLEASGSSFNTHSIPLL